MRTLSLTYLRANARKKFSKRSINKMLTLLAFSTLGFHSSTQAIPINVSYLPTPGSPKYAGFSITNFGTGDAGSAILGTGMQNGTGMSNGQIVFSTLDYQGHPMVNEILLGLPSQDVRAISIVTIDAGMFGAIVQATTSGMPTHFYYVQIDGSGNIINQPLEIFNNGWNNTYPQGAIYYNSMIYVCGYQTSGLYSDLTNMNMTDGRKAFIARIDPGTGATDFLYQETPQNTGQAPFATTLINDYDMFLRMKEVNGKLYVLGSGNGSVNVTSPSYGSYIINSSKYFVGLLDPSSFSFASTKFIGDKGVTGNYTPDQNDGYYGVDLVADPLSSTGGFYCLSNKYDANWDISHLEPTLSVVPGAVNTMYFGQTDITKAFGMFMTPTGSTGAKISVYGTTSATQSLISGSYGTDIAFPSAGAAMLVTSMDAGTYIPGPTGGIIFSNYAQYIEGNFPSTPSGLDYQEPFWSNTTGMRYWQMPNFGYQPDPLNTSGLSSGLGEIVMMGHWSQVDVSHKFTRTDVTGQIPGCPSSLPTYTILYKNSLDNFNVTPISTNENAQVLTVTGVKTPAINEDAYECTSTHRYRLSQPGSTTVAEGPVQAMGLYPNPAKDQVTVKLSSNVQAGTNLSFMLTDITGRMVYTSNAAVSGTDQRFDLPEVAPGIYHATVQYGTAAQVSFKLTIQ